MKEIIKYISTILNIKTDSMLVVADMESELHGIVDISEYKDYLRRNINYLGMEYMTGFQKFIKLTEMYKRQYAERTNKERLSKSQDTAQQLADKVRSVAPYVNHNQNLKPENFSANGECYFTAFERKQLAKIGSLTRCVNLQISVSGEDALLEKLKEQMIEIVMIQAIAKPKEKEEVNKSVASLMNMAASKVRA